MVDDPRWRDVFVFLTQLQANRDAKVKSQFLGGFQEMIAAVEAIEADPAASIADHAAARKILGRISMIVRAHTNEVIRAILDIAENPQVTDVIRKDARRMLREFTERVSPASDKPQ
jgi:hypothetical protein